MTETPRDQRPYDVVVLGATGYSGRLTAEYLAQHAPDGCRWALAGRNRGRLEELRTHLATIDPGLAELPLLQADSADGDSLADLARSTRLVVSAVGPYLLYGGPLVAACADAGTDYVDLTGEPEFVDNMYLEHHDRAVATGARLVHACGFDSIPHDLGARYTVLQLPEGQPVTLRGVVRAGAQFSGGTFHSAMTAFSRARQLRGAMQARRKKEGRPAGGRKARAVAGKPHRDRELGYWLLPLPTIDPFVVARSAAALDRYGPDFRYSHYAGFKTLPYAAGMAAGAGVMLVGAQVPPLRKALMSRVKAGDGPSESRRERSWFTVDFVGQAGGTTVHTRVSGGDPYTESAKLMAESALCLAFDDNPTTSGQVTTAVAMGEHLTQRLLDAGIRFDVR